MAVSDQKLIIGANIKGTINSERFAIYPLDMTGVITSDSVMAEPNVSETTRRGWGEIGIVYREQQFTDQPWSMTIEYNEMINRFMAILTDQEHSLSEDETAALDLQLYGGAINMDGEVDFIFNQLNRARSQYVKGFCWLNSGSNKFSATTPNEGSSGISMSGTAMRGYLSNRPLRFEGWGRQGCDTTPHAVPPGDTQTITADGVVWLRNTTTGNPRKAWCVGATNTHAAPAANPRYDVVIAVEENSGQYRVPVALVAGAELAIPVVPNDAAVQVAVDAAYFAGARWTRLADVYVEVAPVTIVAADITQTTIQTLTYFNTALALSTKVKEDSFLIWDYLIYVKVGGLYKNNLVGITSETNAVLTLDAATTDMVEVVYSEDIVTKYDPLEG